MGKNDRNADGAKIAGQYANYFRIGYNAFEFIVDFGQLYGHGDDAHFHTRIITSPVYAKDFLKLLKDSIVSFEKSFPNLVDNPDPPKSDK